MGIARRNGNDWRFEAITDEGGRASDVIKLIRLITERVEDATGIRLEPEVKIWSDQTDADCGDPARAASVRGDHRHARPAPDGVGARPPIAFCPSMEGD